jgi:hypothetical protein
VRVDERSVGTGDDGSATTSRRVAARRVAARRVAAGICGLEALVLVGFCVFFLWEVVQGGSDDPTRAVMSVVLIAVFAVGLGLLARAWLRGAAWPNTPTIVVGLLLLPVAWSLFGAGQVAIGLLVGLGGVGGVVSAALAKEPPPPPPEAG